MAVFFVLYKKVPRTRITEKSDPLHGRSCRPILMNQNNLKLPFLNRKYNILFYKKN